MLNYITSRWLFAIGLLALVVLRYFHFLDSWLPFLVLILGYSLVEFYGSYFIGSGYFVNAFCSANTEKKIVSLTFDDGPLRDITPAVLDLLAKEQVKATFFCIGRNIEGNEDILKRICEEGHLLGNHSFSHATLFDLLPSGKMKADMKQAEDLILKVTGKKVNYFRPPYGVMTPGLLRAIKALGYQTIGWNIRSLDTTRRTESEVMERIKSRLKPGSVILLHDRMPGTVSLLKKCLDYLKENGYEVVPLDALTQTQAYA